MHAIRWTIALASCALIALTSTSSAQSTAPLPDRRLIVERNVDFYGSDLTALFDTTLDACRNACFADPNCTAFTFNGRSNSCFPKRGVDRREAYEGAVSAIAIPFPPGMQSQALTRASELSFLRQDDLQAARRLAEALPFRHAPEGRDVEALLDAANGARSRGDHQLSLRLRGAALVLVDSADLWRGYAEDALSVRSEDRTVQRQARALALPAAVNAYLRAGASRPQGDALLTLARALEDTRRGRDMVPALRLAERVAPSEAVAQALDDAVAKYGFRIVESRADSDAATPRICATFSEPLERGLDYSPYIQLAGVPFAAEVDDRTLCLEGVEHGVRYRTTFRAGMPAASGESLVRDTTLNLYVRDRTASARFPGRAYVLPKAGPAALPIVTVNADKVELSLHRVAERSLVRMIEEGWFGRPLNAWEEDQFGDQVAETIWSGSADTGLELNREVTTRLPLGDAVADLAPGLYALKARVPGQDTYDQPAAMQWFVLSDLGLATMSGADGLHVFARSLGTADPSEGVTIRLVSRSNRVLGEAVTNANGHATFPPGMTAGRGAAAPALVTAFTGSDTAPEDLAFLSLTDPAFDLSDRGVEGREPAGPVDVFLATDRGAYRAGERIRATALARDGRASAVDGLPLTAILTRPDGVEYSRSVSGTGMAGGHVFDLPLGGGVPRGTWQLAIHADVEAPPLARRALLVEDFLPERIDVTLGLPDGPVPASTEASVQVQADYLFGAPGSGLAVEGELRFRAADQMEAWPGYRFGLHDERVEPRFASLTPTITDPSGAAQLALPLGDAPEAAQPLEARVTVRVSEGSGRPVERSETVALAPVAPVIGIRPEADGVVPEGTEAGFSVIGIAPDGSAAPMRVTWAVNRIETRYQWYAAFGEWNWEPITRRTRVASGEATLGTDPIRITAPVQWGQYEVVVERADGPWAASSVDFYAGWYAPADATATPDTLDVSLDRPTYRPGEMATLRIVPRASGTALVTVVSNRLIDMRAVPVGADPVEVALPVTEEWGAGAYVTATLIQPMATAEGRNPARALGLAHASVDPGAAQLQASFEAPTAVRPRGPLEVALRVEGLSEGETAYATIAAVDQGILNLTGFTPPDASAHYFGQRRLGIEMRDIYGRLIDGMAGQMGRLRSGGDATAQMRMQAPPPTEELAAFFSGPVTVGPDGLARAMFDLPSFNGSLRLMAVVWSDSGVGEAEAEVLVRDPVVLTASLPRFLAPGDAGEMRLEVTHAEGPVGEIGLAAAAEGARLMAALPATITLAEQARTTLTVPVTADRAGLASIALTLTTPGGEVLTKRLALPVQLNDPEVARTSRFTLAEGDSFTLSRDVFTGLRSGTGTATLALGPLARFDAPGLLSALDRYPYGCTEQITSGAMPLLYFGPMARALGLEQRQTVDLRIEQAVDRILSRQTASGGFGLWGTYDSDLWLDAYVTDFLSRARAQGHEVADLAFGQALDALRNAVATAPDFDATSNGGGRSLAYALLVLAREGAAQIGDLRYFADAKGGDFATPLAAAQLGAALALYGEQQRADGMFARAASLLIPTLGTSEPQLWRSDYGTHRRDAAAVLTLAAEAGTQVIDTDTLATRVAAPADRLSTQEAVWSLLAAHALVDTGPGSGFEIDGSPTSGPLVRLLEDDTAARPVTITNRSGRATDLTLTTFGVPDAPVQRSGNGYAIDRQYYTMEGDPADPARLTQGTRLVTVLTVTPFGEREARLMVDDPLPAGFEIDNPNLLRGGDIRALDWLETADARHAEFRQERFLAAVDWRTERPFRLAYIVRAVSPGSYHHPAASVEDMYRPTHRATTDAGRIAVAP